MADDYHSCLLSIDTGLFTVITDNDESNGVKIVVIRFIVEIERHKHQQNMYTNFYKSPHNP